MMHVMPLQWFPCLVCVASAVARPAPPHHHIDNRWTACPASFLSVVSQALTNIKLACLLTSASAAASVPALCATGSPFPARCTPQSLPFSALLCVCLSMLQAPPGSPPDVWHQLLLLCLRCTNGGTSSRSCLKALTQQMSTRVDDIIQCNVSGDHDRRSDLEADLEMMAQAICTTYRVGGWGPGGRGAGRVGGWVGGWVGGCKLVGWAGTDSLICWVCMLMKLLRGLA
jgi:hypothetical protein